MKNKRHKKGKDAPAKQRPVIVAVDFSEYSEVAILWACDFASRVKVPLIALHVVHDPADAPGYYKKDRKDLLRPMEDVAAKMMRKFLKRIQKDNPGVAGLGKMETAMVKGLPVSKILAYAEKLDAGQIVMGSQGRTGLSHLMLGSKAEQVVRLSSIPVTIVKSRKKKKK